MRSRPELKVYLSPTAPIPGSRFEVRAVLTSRSATPINGVEMRLTGIERRYSHTSTSGKSTSRVYKTRTLLALASRTEPRKLGVGEYEYRTHFDLPAELPPAYADDVGSIRYGLDVRVIIPWWPDRHERYEVAVAPPPWRAAGTGARLFATHPDGPRRGEVYIEATLDPESLSVGHALSGAVAVTAQKPIKAMVLAFVATNEARFEAGSHTVRRYELKLAPTPDPRGEAVPFQLRFPASEAPSFDSALMRIRWHLEARADVGWRKHAVLHVPLVIAPLPTSDAPDTALRHLPPVGRERRAKIWAHVAAQNQLANDADSETMTGTIGSVDVRIALEQRGDGLFSVASLRWPDAEIELAVRERRFLDALSRGIDPNMDADFNARFFVSGRDASQVKALLGQRSLSYCLVGMTDAVIEDDGALLAAQGGGHRLDNLAAFVGSVRSFAAAIGEALPSIPPPPSARAAHGAWLEFAQRHQARLVAGSLSVRGLSWEGVELDIETVWDGADARRTRVVHLLDPSLDVSRDEHRRRVDSAKPIALSDVAGRAALVLDVPGLVADPRLLEPRLAEVCALVKALRPADRSGPYR